MKKIRSIKTFFMTALILFGALSVTRIFAASAGELSLTVTYDAKCGAPSTFTAHASGGSGNYMYYLGNITREGEDGQYFVMDPSRLPGYKTDNGFQFTFCASGVYYLDFYVMDKGASPIVTKRTRVKVVLNDPAYPSVETIADRVAAQCKAACRTEYDRALWLHDWLVDHCTYDYSLLYCGSEGALTRGKGTCESYHRAYTMLLNRVGIANGRIQGNGHVWTAVRMDGNWYQVDVTWDDNGYTNHTYENYLYFGLNDTIMKMVHSDHSPNNGYVSNSLSNNYLIRSGTIRRWSDPLATSVRQNLQAGKTSFSVPVTESLPGSNQDVIYNLAAYQLSVQEWSTATHTVQIQARYLAGQMQINASYTPIATTQPDTSATKSNKPTETATTEPGTSTMQQNKPTETATTQPGTSATQQNKPTGTTPSQPGTSATQQNMTTGIVPGEPDTSSDVANTSTDTLPAGTQTQPTQTDPAQIQPVQTEASQEMSSEPSGESFDSQPETDVNATNSENKSNRLLMYIVVCILILCVAGGGVFVWKYLRGKNNKIK